VHLDPDKGTKIGRKTQQRPDSSGFRKITPFLRPLLFNPCAELLRRSIRELRAAAPRGCGHGSLVGVFGKGADGSRRLAAAAEGLRPALCACSVGTIGNALRSGLVKNAARRAEIFGKKRTFETGTEPHRSAVIRAFSENGVAAVLQK